MGSKPGGARVGSNVAELLRSARQQADDESAGDAELLLAHALGRSRTWLYAHREHHVSAGEVTAFQALWQRRLAGEPYAYLVGKREFYGRSFEVTPAVLIPRADTECLLEAALQRWDAARAGVVVDAGSGSGALAISFALERARACVVGVERSAAALAVARRNAIALHASVQWQHGDWLRAFQPGSIDLIMANPPYLAASDAHLGGPGLASEPRTALVAGPSGLEDIQQISAQAIHTLKPGGWLLFEHGAEQGAAVRRCLQDLGYRAIETQPDLEQRDRVTLGQRDTHRSWPEATRKDECA